MPITDELEQQVHRTIRKLYKDFPKDPSIAFVVKSTIEGLIRQKRIKFTVVDKLIDTESQKINKIIADENGC